MVALYGLQHCSAVSISVRSAVGLGGSDGSGSMRRGSGVLAWVDLLMV
jgi:hypothetical protein